MRPLAYTVGTERPVNADTATTFGVQAQMFMAIHPKVGKPWVFGLHQCSYARVWSDEDINLFRDVGRRLADGLSSMLSLRELHERERTLNTLMSNLPGMVYRCVNDRNWTMEFVSDGCEELTGYKPEEVINNAIISYNDIIDPSDREVVRRHIQLGLKERHPYQIIYRIITKAGGQKWVWEQGEGVFNDDDSRVVLEGFITDITAQREAAEAIHDNERKFRAIFDQAYQFAGLLALDGTVLDVNQKALDFVGLDKSDLIGKLFWETPWWRGLPDEQIKLKEAVKKAARGEVVRFETVHPTLDGTISYRDFSLRPVMDEDGNIILLIPESSDITERRLAEEAVKDREQHYRTLFEESPISLWEFDFSGAKQHLVEIQRRGVTDLAAHLENNPDDVIQCFTRTERYQSKYGRSENV